MLEKAVGILGGVGPLSTVYFMDMIIKMTDAKKDQDHINMIAFNHATIPDRTDFIVGKSPENPLPVMVNDAVKLQSVGADFIVIPCNTAHYFFDIIKESVTIPMLNIVEETVKYAIEKVQNLNTIGILATDGTLISNTYQRVCDKKGIKCVAPNKEQQKCVMNLIYNQVKAGKSADIMTFYEIIQDLLDQGCQAVILGCTELSVIKKDFKLDLPYIVDSLEVLARKTILTCNKQIRE